MVLQQANCESQSETCFKSPTFGCLANTIKKERSGEGNDYYNIVVCSQDMSNQEMKNKQKHANQRERIYRLTTNLGWQTSKKR